jgi:hypothetical protein
MTETAPETTEATPERVLGDGGHVTEVDATPERASGDLSPAAREVFAKLVAARQAQASEPEPEPAPELAPAAEPEPAAEVPAPEPVAAAPVVDLAAQIEAKAKALEAREQALAALEGRRDVFVDSPLAAVRQQVADWLGVAVDHPDVKEHLLELVTDISSEELGVSVDSTRADKKTRRLARQLEQFKQTERAAREKSAKEAEEATKAAQRSSAVVYLEGQLKAANAKYPALTAIDNPGEQVLARIEAAHARGERLSVEQAAEQADTEVRNYIQRFSALFTSPQATPATAPAPVSKPSSAQSRIAPPSLRNADASAVVASPKDPPTTTEEAHARTMERIRARRRA